MSRVHRVVAVREGDADVADADGAVHAVSLLAFDGEPPAVGEWVSVHSGYALARLDPAEAEAALALIAGARRAGLESRSEVEP